MPDNLDVIEERIEQYATHAFHLTLHYALFIPRILYYLHPIHLTLCHRILLGPRYPGEGFFCKGPPTCETGSPSSAWMLIVVTISANIQLRGPSTRARDYWIAQICIWAPLLAVAAQEINTGQMTVYSFGMIVMGWLIAILTNIILQMPVAQFRGAVVDAATTEVAGRLITLLGLIYTFYGFGSSGLSFWGKGQRHVWISWTAVGYWSILVLVNAMVVRGAPLVMPDHFVLPERR